MNVTKDLTIWCEHEACAIWRHIESRTAKGARTEAKNAGWTRLGGRDICPEHSANPTSDVCPCDQATDYRCPKHETRATAQRRSTPVDYAQVSDGTS